MEESKDPKRESPASEAPRDSETLETPPPIPDDCAAMRAERDQIFERLARVSADYQNYQRRMEQSVGDRVKLALGDLLKQLIPVIDHFDTALSRKPESEDARAIHDGVRIVRDELLKVMQQAGVERIEVRVGDAFDPHKHEAMLRQAKEGIQPNHVTMTMLPGYAYQGRTLRPAKVAVAPEEERHADL